MAKDPAFLFYYQDFAYGTRRMTFEEKGAYIELLCEQADRGHLTLAYIKNILDDRLDLWDAIQSKFKTDEDGNYYNEVLEAHIVKRKQFTESRRHARLKKDHDRVRAYLIKDNETGLTKIGCSVNPKRIFAEMSSDPNKDYELKYESPVIERHELNTIHERYAEKRVTGDWFEITDQDTKNIRKTYVRRMENENENVNVIENEVSNSDSKLENKRVLFKKPSIEELLEYIVEANLGMDAQEFYDYYESNGWKVGRNPMKDWKASARNWARRDKKRSQPQLTNAQKKTLASWQRWKENTKDDPDEE